MCHLYWFYTYGGYAILVCQQKCSYKHDLCTILTDVGESEPDNPDNKNEEEVWWKVGVIIIISEQGTIFIVCISTIDIKFLFTLYLEQSFFYPFSTLL